MFGTTELAAAVQKTAKRFLYGSTSQPEPNLYPLTEHLSYLLKHADELTINEVTSIIRTPGYNIMAPYFGLKLLDQDFDQQEIMLRNIATSFSHRGGFAEAAEAVEAILAGQASINKVSAKELSRVATWGPAAIDERAHQVLTDIRSRDRTPVIIGYGGLLTLRAAVDTTKVGQEIYVVFPKRIATGHLGFKLIRTETDMQVHQLQKPDFIGHNFTLVDDATHTGDTLETTKQLFPAPNSLMFSPLYRT